MLSPHTYLSALTTYLCRSRYPISNTEALLGVGRWWTVHIGRIDYLRRHFTAYDQHNPPCHRKWKKAKKQSIYVDFCTPTTRYRSRSTEPW